MSNKALSNPKQYSAWEGKEVTAKEQEFGAFRDQQLGPHKEGDGGYPGKGKSGDGDQQGESPKDGWPSSKEHKR
jgi:hypothetical protein